MIYIAVQLIQIFSAGPASQPASQPRGSEVVQEVLADLKIVPLQFFACIFSQKSALQCCMVTIQLRYQFVQRKVKSLKSNLNL